MMRKPSNDRDLLIVFYNAFIGILTAFFIVVTLKIAFSPACTSTTQQVCVIDSSSILGLTAAVFGVAATLLALLGAFAVAYWWANLDKRVEKRTNELIEQRLQEQEVNFQTQISKSVETFEEKVSKVTESLESLKKDMILATTLRDPWEIESWARDLLKADHLSEITYCMTVSYLREVDGFLLDPPEPPKRTTLYFAPSDDPMYYWNKALKWQKEVEKQNIPERIENTKREVHLRRSKVEAGEFHRQTK